MLYFKVKQFISQTCVNSVLRTMRFPNRAANVLSVEKLINFILREIYTQLFSCEFTFKTKVTSKLESVQIFQIIIKKDKLK